MTFTNYAGINYGKNLVNYDKETGIHYGVINANEVPFWIEDSEPYYGKPCCPKCGNEAIDYCEEYNKNETIVDSYELAEYECNDFVCHDCQYVFGSESAFPEEPLSWYIDDKEYSAECSGDDNDIFVMKSPYYTYAQFCSPCAPSACSLSCPLQESIAENKAYCLGINFFDEDNPCPYPVYSVETNECIYDPRKK